MVKLLGATLYVYIYYASKNVTTLIVNNFYKPEPI